MPETLRATAVGPVDIAVFLFEGNEFNGDVAPALLELADAGTVRIIDASFVLKDLDGSVSSIEIEDADVAEAFARLTGEQFDLLSEDDLTNIASDLDPGSSALVIVWENTWAARFASAVRESNGQLLSLDRIPHEIVAAAIAALDEE